MSDDLESLRREVGRLRALVRLLLLAAGAAGVVGFRASDGQVLRARGLVIVDDRGRERVLIGAPIPAARNRVRTDTARVRAAWGPRFPKRYMAVYPTYRNAMHGVLVLNEDGYDVVALGDSLPDPNIGQRSASHAGVVFNTADGFERGGIGVQHGAEGYSVGLGLDSPTQSDAVGLWVSDRRGAYLTVASGDAQVEVGRLRAPRQPGGSAAGPAPVPPEFGLVMRSGDTVRHRLTVPHP